MYETNINTRAPYDYRAAIREDIRDYIRENIDLAEFPDLDALYERLTDDLWVCDSVTGNASGSYFCNAYRAEEALAHNWDLLTEAAEELCCSDIVLTRGAEFADVTIRCYLLGECIAAVLDDLGNE